MRRPVLITVLIGALVLAQRRLTARRAERELWAEAGVARDLR